MASPPAPMRNMLHSRARKFIWSALAVSVGATVAHNVFYVYPRAMKYEEFFKNYDAYSRMKEICDYKHVPFPSFFSFLCCCRYKYMHTCPTELAKLAEEKGMEIAALD
ncbi:COX6C domain-containing protein [Aphelenchoides fujianensis]|nr:COX6C domain-containing protein [Aphelenchoides fujianensis]